MDAASSAAYSAMNAVSTLRPQRSSRSAIELAEGPTALTELESQVYNAALKYLLGRLRRRMRNKWLAN